MTVLKQLLHAVSALAALVAICGIMTMMLHISADVLWRSLMGSRLPATVEVVSKYYMVMIAFLPLGWTELRREMIKVDLLDSVLRGPVEPFNLGLINLISLGVYCGLAWSTWGIAMKEMASRSFIMALNTPIPVWPTYFLLPLGFGIAAIMVLLRLMLDLQKEDPSNER
jgi:TRAP-type C4-dicarboxylate transport system permease small subunit